MLSYVKAVGIELEGGWDARPPMGDRFREDGSVSTRGREWSGELPSPILESWTQAKRFIAENYPCHTGASCGMHVHMSFHDQTRAVSAILDSELFLRSLVKNLEAWGKKRNRVSSRAFYHRLSGENEFCSARWLPEGGIHDWRGRSPTRYTIVNFRSLSSHGTVEIRVLPMFRSRRLAAKAARRVIAFTEDYLRKAAGLGLGADIEEAFSVNLASGDTQPLVPAEEPNYQLLDVLSAVGVAAPVDAPPRERHDYDPDCRCGSCREDGDDYDDYDRDEDY